MADDSVDPELVERPRRWDMRFIGRFMVEFGLLSSVFDFLTFGVLLCVFHASPEVFRTGWFVESLLTELVIALVVRTRRPFFRSRPGTILLARDGYSRSGHADHSLSAVRVGVRFRASSGDIDRDADCDHRRYVAAAEVTKHWFYRAAP